MTTSRTLAIGLLAPLLFSVNGCLEETVRTTIAADGSSTRIISMKVQTREIPTKAFPAPPDSTWSVEWKELGEKDAKFEYTARKSFPTPEALERERPAAHDSGAIGAELSLRKEFAWFFTYFEYEERYTFRNPFADVPVSRYLTVDEVARVQRGEEGESLKWKVDRWYARVQFEDVYGALIAAARQQDDPALPAQLLIERKDACFELLHATDSSNAGARGQGKDSAENPLRGARDLLRLWAGVFGSDALYGLEPAAQRALERVAEKEEAMRHPDGWVNTVEMPGLLLATNSDVVEGNSVTWKFSPHQVRVGPYAMRASSRVNNLWAFIATGLVVVLVVLLAFVPRFRKQKKPSLTGGGR